MEESVMTEPPLFLYKIKAALRGFGINVNIEFERQAVSTPRKLEETHRVVDQIVEISDDQKS